MRRWGKARGGKIHGSGGKVGRKGLLGIKLDFLYYKLYHDLIPKPKLFTHVLFFVFSLTQKRIFSLSSPGELGTHFQFTTRFPRKTLLWDFWKKRLRFFYTHVRLSATRVEWIRPGTRAVRTRGTQPRCLCLSRPLRRRTDLGRRFLAQVPYLPMPAVHGTQCKRKLEPDTREQAVSKRAGAALPLDQGKFGTCVAHAIATALSQNLSEKFGVPCPAEKLVEKFKTLIPCYEGGKIKDYLEKWNTMHAEDGACIEYATWLYRVKFDFRKIDNFEEAYRAMQTAESQRMHMVGVIKTSQNGHSLHAVALQACVPGKEKMTSVNSWGATEPYKDVTLENFVHACTFDPIIVAAKEGDKSWISQGDQKFPQPQEIYVERGKSEKARVAAEAKERARERERERESEREREGEREREEKFIDNQ